MRKTALPTPKTRPNATTSKLLQKFGVTDTLASSPIKSIQTKELQNLFSQAMHYYNAGFFLDAEPLIRECLAINAQNEAILNVLALILAQTKRIDEAELYFKQLLSKHPNSLDGLINYGRFLQLNKRPEEAETYLKKGIRLYPKNYSMHLNLGVVYDVLNRHQLAEQHSRKAIAINPKEAQAHFNLGKAQQNQYHFANATKSYKDALRLNPKHAGAQANLIFIQHYSSDFSAQAILEESKKASMQLMSDITPYTTWLNDTNPHRPLRIGFVSGDLRTHPVGYFLSGILAEINLTDFQLIAYSNSEIVDKLTVSMHAFFTQWRCVDDWSEQQIANTIYADKIDILIDLSGRTAKNCLQAFAYKPAPLQITWLGYFGTTGLATMDYILADPYCVPVNEEYLYSETVWRLPYSRFCMAIPTEAPPVNALPALSKPYITLGCFQELAKINDNVLALWANVLKAVPTAIIRLQSAKLDLPDELRQMQRRFKAHGIDAARIELHGKMSRAAYFECYHKVDFILDTFPYPGGTTTAEALWMGVPTLTITGLGMLARQGEAMLKTVGLHEWVCENPDIFMEKIHYLTCPEGFIELANLRATLRDKAQQSVLFNAKAFTVDFEIALKQLWQQHNSVHPTANPITNYETALSL